MYTSATVFKAINASSSLVYWGHTNKPENSHRTVKRLFRPNLWSYAVDQRKAISLT